MPSLSDKLDIETKECPLTQNQYIPAHIVHEEVTWGAVKRLRDGSPSRDSSLKLKLERAKKVIAVLVLIGRCSAIDALLSEGVSDEDLPLSSQDNLSMQSRCGNKSFAKSKEWEQGAIKGFLKMQWMVLEPTLNLNATTATNTPPLDGRCALEPAFSSCREISNPNPNGVKVYKCVLRRERQKGKSGNSDPMCVAVKRFEQSRIKDFVKERDILVGVQSKGIKNKHLIKHLMSDDKVRCIVFPWAQGGDLVEFWRRASRRVPSDFLWALKQMVGLAHALKDLHKQNFRHGDLKPANILCFIEDGVDVLKIADMGVARAHQYETSDFHRAGTITKASTRAYEGPEVHIHEERPENRSRRYDSWSMGCIILEFVVWLLYDFAAIESFGRARHGHSQQYYLAKPPVSNPQTAKPEDMAEVHPKVREAIEGLLNDPRCGKTALKRLINLVEEDLLKIDRDHRLTAKVLHEKLKGIYAKVSNSDSFLRDIVKFSSVKAPIFRQQPLTMSPELTTQYTTQYTTQ